jgi:hypothetical protein
MNFLQLCQTLRREAGVSGTGPSSVTGQSGEYLRLVNWINQAWNEIQLMRPDWRFMWRQGSFTTIAGAADYSQASIGHEIVQYDLDGIVLTDGNGAKRDLIYIPYYEWKARFSQSTFTNGVPTWVTDMPDGGLRLTVPPDDTYGVTFDYYSEPIPLVANTDEPGMPERYHMLIVHKAMMYYAGYESAPEVLQDAILRWNPLYLALEASQIPSVGFGHTPLGNE